jgi:hypothetical protein
MGSMDDVGAFGVASAFEAPALKKSSKSSTEDFVDEVAGFIVDDGFWCFGVDVADPSASARARISASTSGAFFAAEVGRDAYESTLADDRNRASPTGASDSGDDNKSPTSFVRLADMEDTRDNDDFDAVASVASPRAVFDADAMDTRPSSSSKPSMRLSSVSCAIISRRISTLVAVLGDSGLDPSSLTLLDALKKSNKSRSTVAVASSSRARASPPFDVFAGTL